jgi:cytochrome c peroxidase
MSMHRTSLNRMVLTSIVSAALVLAPGAMSVAHAQVQTYTCTAPGGFGPEAAIAPPVLLSSLKTVANPVIPKDPVTGAPMIRGDLAPYIVNLQAAIQLGKALFWDMQAGSDSRTACASCHFNAGGDVRDRNQLSPGPNGSWDSTAFGPNSTLWAGGFPFTTTVADSDNIVGSQGIRNSVFKGITSTGGELNSLVADPTFSVGGKNVRAVTGKNAPSVINAVFNHRNFFNGRAQPEFNGVNPFGNRDITARVWVLNSYGVPTKIDIHIKNASLASQAVGPPLNTVEMSAAGRTFPDIGKKLLLLKPLGLQRVDAGDSVLGALADSSTGLRTTYAAMIQQAFNPNYWNSTSPILIGTTSYSMLQANFSMFWGLSIMMYEATLVSDDSAIDRYLAYRAVVGGVPNPALLDDAAARIRGDLPTMTRDRILNGLALFELPTFPTPPPNGVGCIFCHGGAELTNASVTNLTLGLEPADANFKKFGFDLRMERMFLQIPPVPAGTNQVTFDPATYNVTATNTVTGVSTPARVGTYDTGWYNIGVRPTADDPGLDAKDPFGKFLSWTRMLQNQYADPSFLKVPGNGLGCGTTILNNASGFPLLSGGLKKTENVDTAGTFKVLALRNAELNGPYFHNGGKATLAQVLEFYDKGGDFTNPTLAPLIRPLGLTDDEQADLVAFLLSLTDERVRNQQAPFDHPQLFVVNGDDPNAIGTDGFVEIPAVGAAGGYPQPRFLNLNPFMP